ncbi:rod-determining factor RdfA [Haloferax sp. Atlit-10N]|nr:rod-determining factor RdfA [Haloferax sp. Atlit-10N]
MPSVQRMENRTGTACGCKISRAAEQYQLDELDERLYHAHQIEGASLRELETVVNRRILESALQDVGVETLGDVSDLYQRLTDDDVSAGDRAELRTRLEQVGVDLSQVESDFVTYQTVRKHLRQSLGVDTSGGTDLTVSDAHTRIHRLQSRSEAVITETLEHLRRAETIEAGKLDVVLSMRVSCECCGDSYRLADLLNQGHCQCRGKASQEPEESIQ